MLARARAPSARVRPGCCLAVRCLPSLAGCVRAKCGHFAMTNLLHVRARARRRLSKNNLDGCCPLLFNDCTLGKIIHRVILSCRLNSQYISKWINANPIKIFSRAA